MNESKKCNLIFSAILLVSIATVAVSADLQWNQWRGPNGDAISLDTGLIQAWPEAGPKLLWKADGMGEGFSGLSFWDDKIFTMGDKDGSSCLLCLNKADGPIIWAAKVGKPGGNDPKRPGPRSTPAVDGERVITVGQYGELICVDIKDGKEIWRKSYQADFGGTEVPRWNFCDSPLLDGDKVICFPGGSKGAIVALDKKTGNLIWQSSEVKDNASYSSPILAEINSVRQYIAVSDARVFALNAQNGKLLWQIKREARNVIPNPIYRDGILFISSGYNAGAQGYKITAQDGTFKAEQIYQQRSISNQHGGAILVKDYVYVSIDQGGKLTCLNFKTGDIIWQNKSVGKASLGYADGNLIVRSEDGPVALVEATPDGYKEKGRFDQPDRSDYNSWPHPVIANSCLYLHDNDILLCYDLKK